MIKRIKLFLVLNLLICRTFYPINTTASNNKSVKIEQISPTEDENKLINLLDLYLKSKEKNYSKISKIVTENKDLINLKVNDIHPLQIVLDREEEETDPIHNSLEIFSIVHLLLENGANINFTYTCVDKELPIIFDFLYLITTDKFYDYIQLFIKHDLLINEQLIERVKYHQQYAKKEIEKKQFKKVLELLNKHLSVKNFTEKLINALREFYL
ncbi:MAG: hypothetical protein ABIF12_02500 [bacterium]